MKKMQQGFTLIELMIVVAIIAILAAIAIPQYQSYVARSAVSKAMGEVSALRTAVEECLSRGVDPSDATACENADYRGDGALVNSIGVGGTGDLVLTPTNAPSNVSGLTLTYNRNVDGVWTCSTSAAAKYTPNGCTGT